MKKYKIENRTDKSDVFVVMDNSTTKVATFYNYPYALPFYGEHKPSGQKEAEDYVSRIKHFDKCFGRVCKGEKLKKEDWKL